MNNRIWLKVLSILLGVFAWIYVNLVISPQIRRTLPAEVEYRNVPELVKIAPAKPTVQLQMEGTRRDFMLSSNGRAQVSVDLYNVRPGRAQLPVRVTPAPGLTVVSVSPPQVQIEVIPLSRKKFDVRIEMQGIPADGYLADQPRFSPDQVTLEGPESIINRVTGCFAEVNLDQIRNSISEQRTVKILLEGGLNPQEIVVTPEKINLDIMVKEGFPTKRVKLAKPVFYNRPPEGKKLENFRVTPENIVIRGATRKLATIEDLSFKPVDLSSISGSASMSVKLELPEGIKLATETIPILEIELADSMITRSYHGLPFELKKSEHQHTSVSVSSYSLEVEGFLHDIDKVRNAQLQMILDIEKMRPGSYPVSLTAPTGLPENVSVVKIRPDELTVYISELPADIEPTATETQAIPDSIASTTLATDAAGLGKR